MLRDLVVLLAATLPIVFVLQKLKVPSIVGFLVAGVILGPHGSDRRSITGSPARCRRMSSEN